MLGSGSYDRLPVTSYPLNRSVCQNNLYKMRKSKKVRVHFQNSGKHYNVKKGQTFSDPPILQKDLLDLPFEIITHLLTYMSPKDLSTNVYITCTKVFNICQDRLNGRFRITSSRTLKTKFFLKISKPFQNFSKTFKKCQMSLHVYFEC